MCVPGEGTITAELGHIKSWTNSWVSILMSPKPWQRFRTVQFSSSLSPFSKVTSMIKANLPTSQLANVKLEKRSASRNTLMERCLHLVLFKLRHSYHLISLTNWSSPIWKEASGFSPTTPTKMLLQDITAIGNLLCTLPFFMHAL